MELQDLFLKLQEGDFTFFDTFYERSKNVVFYNILSYTKNYDISEDILQETYVKFLAAINNINKNVNIENDSSIKLESENGGCNN